MLLRVRCKCTPPAIVASAFKSRAATTLANRYVRSVCIQRRTGDPDPSHLMSMLLRFFLITVTSSTTLYRIEGSRIEPNGSYPTPGDGHEFKMNIFGLLFSTQGRWQKRRERRKVDTLCLWKIRSLAATQTL